MIIWTLLIVAGLYLLSAVTIFLCLVVWFLRHPPDTGNPWLGWTLFVAFTWPWLLFVIWLNNWVGTEKE